MNGYTMYLENIIELREKELDMYKNFVENELKCRIREEVLMETKVDKKCVREIRFKVITIPQSQYILQLDN